MSEVETTYNCFSSSGGGGRSRRTYITRGAGSAAAGGSWEASGSTDGVAAATAFRREGGNPPLGAARMDGGNRPDSAPVEGSDWASSSESLLSTVVSSEPGRVDSWYQRAGSFAIGCAAQGARRRRHGRERLGGGVSRGGSRL